MTTTSPARVSPLATTQGRWWVAIGVGLLLSLTAILLIQPREESVAVLLAQEDTLFTEANSTADQRAIVFFATAYFARRLPEGADLQFRKSHFTRTAGGGDTLKAIALDGNRTDSRMNFSCFFSPEATNGFTCQEGWE